jgi:Protein of unknown function (DUF3102)
MDQGVGGRPIVKTYHEQNVIKLLTCNGTLLRSSHYDRKLILPSHRGASSMSDQEPNALAARSLDRRNGPHAAVNFLTSGTNLPVDKRQRPLEVIAADLNSALKRETTDIIKIGSLLVEAKAQLPHGKWLLWVTEHFPLSKSTVANYVNAYRFAIEFPNVGNLKIRPSALYMLASGLFNGKEIAVILKKAETQWVDSSIAYQIKPQPIRPEPHRALQSKTERKPLSNPSALPPSPKAQTDTHFRQKFAAAVLDLEKLRTQPSAKFAGVISASCLLMICDFLHQVAAVSQNVA